MRGPTHKQLLVLEFVRAEIAAHGSAPTFREIGEHMGIASTNGVNDHLRALERKGWLARRPGRARAMALTPAGAALLQARSAVQVDARVDSALACGGVVGERAELDGSLVRAGIDLVLADLRALTDAPLSVACTCEALLRRAIAVLERLLPGPSGPTSGDGRGR